MVSKGMRMRDISLQIQDIYGIEMSHESISKITDKILPIIKEWQAKPLKDIYPIIFLDAIHCNIKSEGKKIKKAAYVVLGVDIYGIKEILGIYVGENETSKFWLSVLTDIKNRGVKDVLIASVDSLNGFKEAITHVFPKTDIQRCIVHQIRNSLKFVSYKDRKQVIEDLKTIYQATNEEMGLENLTRSIEKWNSKYLLVFKSWKENWETISTFYRFSNELKKIMYTTNVIENLNRQYRKVLKTKGSLPNDEALMKILYLVKQNVEKNGQCPIKIGIK